MIILILNADGNSPVTALAHQLACRRALAGRNVRLIGEAAHDRQAMPAANWVAVDIKESATPLPLSDQAMLDMLQQSHVVSSASIFVSHG
jgi:hypothetical protein